jgi:ADP-ribose pyrophosphatase YjhB (NUDIX family)
MKYTAQVVLLNEEGLVLGVSRKDNHNDFGLPGGKMEETDASLVMTAIRETLEETGLVVSNLQLVFAIHKDSFMSHTYLAEYKGEINHNEPHVVKWLPFNRLIEGSFGKYNKMVAESLEDMGIFFIKDLPMTNVVEDELRECVSKYGFIYNGLLRGKNWLGVDEIELRFRHNDGSFIDEDFYNIEMIQEVASIANKHDMNIRIPSEYLPK